MKASFNDLNLCSVFLSVMILAIGGLLLLPLGAWASHKPCDCAEQICGAQGFEIELTDFNVNQTTGMSSWTYQICREALGLKICSPRICDSNSGGNAGDECTQDSDCQPPSGGACLPAGGGDGQTGESCTADADCVGVCVPCASDAGLAHVEIVLPGLGECITDAQTVNITKIGGDGMCTPAGVTNQDSQCPDELCAPGTGGMFCTSGGNLGNACQRSTCPGGSCTNGVCVGGGGNGDTCCGGTGQCNNVPCAAVSAICTGGFNKEELCNMITDCPDMVSVDAECTALTGNCVGGTNDGMQCTMAADCPAPGFCSKLDVLKCADATLDKGDCIELLVTVAGEIPTIGPGTIDTVTRSQNECAADQICGPACACEESAEGCLTRSRGFWGHHPLIAANILPITVCGKTLSNSDAGSCMSVTEAVCSNSNDGGKGNQAYVQLVAQLAAAKLNLAATDANGGDCGSEIEELIADCEALCGADQATISSSGCIEDLDHFNESQDTFDMTPAPFDQPGPADPSMCKPANGNKLVIGKGPCS